MKNKRRWIALVLACLLGTLSAFPIQATQSGLDSAREQLSALEQEKQRTEQVLADLESLKNDAAAYVRQLDSSLEVINDELTALGEGIGRKEAEIETTQEELQEARETEREQYEAMKLRIQYMYEKGDSSYVDILMDAGSLSEILNRVEYISRISEYDRQKLDEYIATRDRIAAKELQLEEEHAELLSLQEETKAKQASVEELLKAKQAELENYENQIAQAEGQLSEYERDMEAQENAIRAIEEEIRRKEEEARKRAETAGQTYKTVNLGDISFIWPCPSSSRITSAFGGRSSPTEGASSDHKGIDIGAASGSDILAAAAGEVVVSTYSYSAGNYVMLSHGGGVYTVYMHASKLLVSQGESVKQGQVIAKVGSTGYSTGPHLHFGIRVNGTYVNPSQYVSP